MGININDKKQPFTEQILNGTKTIETRNTDSLRSKVGHRVGIVRTGKGKAILVGFAVIGSPKIYSTVKAFRTDQNKHQVAKGSPFDIKKKKFGYPMLNVEVLEEPIIVKNKGIVFRNISDII